MSRTEDIEWDNRDLCETWVTPNSMGEPDVFPTCVVYTMDFVRTIIENNPDDGARYLRHCIEQIESEQSDQQ